LPTIVAGADGLRESIVHHSLDGMFAFRQGPWKWIEGLGSGGFTAPKRIQPSDGPSGQLYHLEDDPGELNNLATTHAEVAERLQRQLDQVRLRAAP